MSKRLEPYGDRVLVKLSDTVTRTPGGIELPQSMNDGQPREAVVVAVGDGYTHHSTATIVAPGVKEGDIVLIGAHRGIDLRMGGVNLVLVDTLDILGVIRG